MVAFKKYQVDACVMTDPTHARVECVKCIDIQMNTQISKNVITGVTLPSGFIPQDYSKEIAELRMQRKVAALTKQSRKAKCAKSDDDDSCDEDDDDTRKPVAVKKSRKAKRVVDMSEDEDEDEVLVRPAKALRKATSVNKGKVVARATGGKGKMTSSEEVEPGEGGAASGEVAAGGVASSGVAFADSESSDSDVSEGKPDEVNKGEVKSGEVES
jgi:hypothetical protein